MKGFMTFSVAPHVVYQMVPTAYNQGPWRIRYNFEPQIEILLSDTLFTAN